MPVPQDTRIQSDDPGESIIVLQKEASAEFPSPPPFRTSRPFVIMEPRHEIEERDEYEVTLSPKPRPQLSIPNWNAHRESNGESSKSYEAAKPNRYFPPQETTSDASRGRKRKAMSDEDKQRANLVRRLGACPNCRRRKLAVSQ